MDGKDEKDTKDGQDTVVMVLENLDALKALLLKEQCAVLVHWDGTIEKVTPENGRDFKIQQLHKLLDCSMVEVVYMKHLPRSWIMVIDEEGKLTDKEFNPVASKFYGSSWDKIVGHALICPSAMVE